MSTTNQDPVAVAREILEGNSGKKESSEGLKKALKTAVEEGKSEFNFEGKTYKVSDLEEGKEMSGGDTVPAADTTAAEKSGTKKMKHDKNKPSHADDEDVEDAEAHVGQPQKEGVVIDIDDVVASLEESDESEDMVALFGGEELTEDFKNKARTIFETAVRARVKDVAVKLEEQANSKVEDLVESTKAELTESIDDYLNYVVEQWMKENQVAVDKGIKTDIAESFMMGLKQLFESHYIDMPQDRYDMLAGLQGQVSQLQKELSESISNNVELNKRLGASKCSEVFSEVSEGLVDTEVEKLAKLAEGIEFDSTDQYAEKLNILKESYFENTAPSKNVLNEETNEDVPDDKSANFLTPDVRNYAQYMDRQQKHNNF